VRPAVPPVHVVLEDPEDLGFRAVLGLLERPAAPLGLASPVPPVALPGLERVRRCPGCRSRIAANDWACGRVLEAESDHQSGRCPKGQTHAIASGIVPARGEERRYVNFGKYIGLCRHRQTRLRCGNRSCFWHLRDTEIAMS
jgi:hypothetical protein